MTMINFKEKTKYHINYSNLFKRKYKLIKKQGKNIEKLKYIVKKLANCESLEEKYKNHMLTNSKHYKNCGECHIEPDWLLIYRINKNELFLFLSRTGTHSDLLE